LRWEWSGLGAAFSPIEHCQHRSIALFLMLCSAYHFRNGYIHFSYFAKFTDDHQVYAIPVSKKFPAVQWAFIRHKTRPGHVWSLNDSSFGILMKILKRNNCILHLVTGLAGRWLWRYRDLTSTYLGPGMPLYTLMPQRQYHFSLPVNSPSSFCIASDLVVYSSSPIPTDRLLIITTDLNSGQFRNPQIQLYSVIGRCSSRWCTRVIW
jgi:hypothetical protein